MRSEADVGTGRGLAWTLGATGLSVALLAYVALAGVDAHGHVSATTYAAGATVVMVLSFLALARGLHGRRRAEAVPRRRAFPGAEIAEFEALPPWAHRMRWVAVGLTTSPWIVLNLLRFMPPFTIAIVVGLYALLGLPTLIPRRIAIGEDGLLLRWAGQKRFVPYGELVAARGGPLGLELDLASGETLEIRLGHRPDARARQREEMLGRIDDGMRAQRALERAEDEALLARGHRPLASWIEESEALGRSEIAGYRTVAMPRERLWAVLENPAAEPSAREAAAIALRAQLADEERDRLERVARRSASPRLRVTLEAVASGSNAAELRIALEDELLAEDDVAPSRARGRELP